MFFTSYSALRKVRDSFLISALSAFLNSPFLGAQVNSAFNCATLEIACEHRVKEQVLINELVLNASGQSRGVKIPRLGIKRRMCYTYSCKIASLRCNAQSSEATVTINLVLAI